MLTDRQLEIINGSLLGDGCIRKKNRGYNDNCSFVKSQSQFDHEGIDKITYMKWMYNNFESFSSRISLTKRNEYEFSTKSHKVFTELENKWYVKEGNKRIKIVPVDLKLTLLTIYVWFIDDGINVPYKRQAKMCTNCFTVNECEFLVAQLDTFGVKSKVSVCSNGQPNIYIGAKTYKNFILMLSEFDGEFDCYKHKTDLTEFKERLSIRSGEVNGCNKLTNEDVEKMKTMYCSGEKQYNIANNFNVNQSTVSRIVNSLRWKHL